MVAGLALAAGAALGGGLSFLEGRQQDDARDSDRQINQQFQNVLRGAFQNDPLLNQILGSLSGQQGAIFNPDDVFEAGQEQIGLTKKRREFDALRQLAAQGFDAGGDQQQFFNNAAGQQEGFENSNLRDSVDLAFQQLNPQQQQQDFDLFSGLLGQTLGTGAAGGVLGQRAPGSPQEVSGPFDFLDGLF